MSENVRRLLYLESHANKCRRRCGYLAQFITDEGPYCYTCLPERYVADAGLRDYERAKRPTPPGAREAAS